MREKYLMKEEKGRNEQEAKEEDIKEIKERKGMAKKVSKTRNRRQKRNNKKMKIRQRGKKNNRGKVGESMTENEGKGKEERNRQNNPSLIPQWINLQCYRSKGGSVIVRSIRKKARYDK